MEYDLAGVSAGHRWLKQAFIVFALIIVPHSLAAQRTAKANYISSMIAGSAKALDLMVSIKTLLPFPDKNFPFRSIVAPDLFYDIRDQHRLDPSYSLPTHGTYLRVSMNELNFQLAQYGAVDFH
jgi:hypothetical protein